MAIRNFTIFAFFFLLVTCLSAQKHDYVWLFGYGPTAPGFGNSRIDFNFSPPQVSSVSLGVNFQSCGGSCADSSGNLLFYTNGIRVFNHLNEIMEGGDTINPGPVWNSMQAYGYVSIVSPFSLPLPGADNVYYLFHTDVYNANGTSHIGRLYYSVVDMKANNGLGKLLEKNVAILDGDLMWPCAVKHGNGRDWWVMGLKSGDTNHYLFLLTSDGISGPFVQDFGPPFDSIEYAGKSLFSQDGSMYLRHDSKTALRLYDFDRCTGMLSNLRIIPYQEELHSWTAAFSPDDRFLYISRPRSVWSIDVLSTDISMSYDTVSMWELNFCPYYPFSSQYLFSQLGPDDKIYYSNNAGATRCLNVIHRPNLPGDAADCEEAAVELPGFNSLTLMQFPNYRLGEWEGSPCDTVNFQSSSGGFEKTVYHPDGTSLPESSYKILPPIPGGRCEGCTKEDLEFLNNPMKCVQALYEYRATGKVPHGWPAEQAAKEGIYLALPPERE